MKRLKIEDLPEVLTPEIIDTLAQMADEVPQSQEWQLIFERLKKEDYRKVMDRKVELQKQEAQKRQAMLTDEEKRKEAEKWQRIKDDDTPRFYGNMGEPETPEEYERKWGIRKDT